MLADAHIHLFDRSSGDGAGQLVADEVAVYERLRDEHRIGRSLVVGYEGESWAQGNNRFLADVARDRPWVAPLAYQRCDSPPASDEIRRLLDNGFAGISAYVSSSADVAAFRDWPAATLQELAQTRSIISLNIAAHHLGGLEEVFDRLGSACVLLSHLGLPGPPKTWPKGDFLEALRPVLQAARHEAVGVKVSGLYAVSDPPHRYSHSDAWPLITAIRESFGVERLYWGSDFPSVLERLSFPQTVDVLNHLSWTPHEFELVMGANMIRAIESVDQR